MKKYDVGVPYAGDLDPDRPMDRDIWLREVFPEWGTFLNKQIEKTKVKKGTFVLWWFGGCAFYLKTPGDANILIDSYCGQSVYITYEGGAGPTRNDGAEEEEWLRCNPHVVDPWAFKKVDALLSSHYHSDHCDIYTIKPLTRNTNSVFVGPPESCKYFAKYGVPKNRIVEMQPGDEHKIKDVTIKGIKSTDYCAVRSGEIYPGKNVDNVALSYLIKTPAGNIFHDGDSMYSDYYFRIGKENKIDVALLNCGNSPISFTDKMSFADAARVSMQLGAKVAIPMHYDNWAITEGDPVELEELLKMKAPDIKSFIMKCGGRFEWPTDKDKGRYTYPKQVDRARPKLSWVYGDNPREKVVLE